MTKRKTKYMVLVNDQPRIWNPEGPCFAYMWADTRLQREPYKLEDMLCGTRRTALRRIEKDVAFHERTKSNIPKYSVVRVSVPEGV